MSITRKRLIVAVSVLAVACAGVAIAVASTGGDEPTTRCGEYRFDVREWTRGGDARTRQGRRLADCRALIGMRRDAVRRLLGRPDERDQHTLAYQLGPDSLHIDSEYLELGFAHGAVVRTRIYNG